MTRTPETAIELDSAIDTILRGPIGPADVEEGELSATARLLRDALPRLHPRFTFEEHLAARLAAARRIASGPLEAAPPVPIQPRLAVAGPVRGDEVDTDETDAGQVSAEHRRLGLVAGGAIASGVSLAGVSLAGAALVVWRRSRSGGVF